MYATIALGIIAIILTFLYDKHIFRWGFAVAMISLTVFTAIRYEWGVDMPAYEKMFNEINTQSEVLSDLFKFDIIGLKSGEYGWRILNYLCQPIGFFGMTMLISAFEGCVVYWFIKKYVPLGYLWFAVFIYVFNSNLLVLGCSMMRQWLATCIILTAMPAFAKGRPIRYFLLVYIASTIHTSALLFAPLFLFRILRNMELTLSRMVPLVFVTLLWLYVLGNMLGGRFFDYLFSSDTFEMYSSYQVSIVNSENDLVGSASLLNCIIILICVFVSYKSSQDITAITWLMFGYIIVLPLLARVPMMGRLTFYCETIGLMAFPNGYKNIKSSILKTIILIWILFWYLYLFFGFFSDSNWRHSFYEYHTIFEAPYWM